MMLFRLHRTLRLIAAISAITIFTLLEAGALENPATLVRNGDVAAIEAAFAARQAAFNAGDLGPDAYREPYGVFATTDPAIKAVIADWRAQYPDSPHAALAQAERLVHIAYLIRGGDVADRVPEAAMAQFLRLGKEARALLLDALEAEPRHLAAAHVLMRLGNATGSDADRDRGFEIVASLDDPASALLSGLDFTYPRWGGSVGKIRAFCAEWAPKVPDISYRQCLAKANYDHGYQNPALFKSAIDVLSKGSIDHFIEQHIAALSRDRRMEEAYALAKAHGFMSRDLAYALANGLQDFSFIEDFVDESLKRDPLNPNFLAERAAALAQGGDPEGAWAAIDKAMLYGTNSPFVRYERLALMSADEQRRWGVPDEIVDAMEATDGSVQIVGSEMIELMNPPETFTHLADGRPRPDFACTRLRLFEAHERACLSDPTHYSCEAGMTVRRDTLMIEARAKNVCGVVTGKTWQDVVRYLLDLTE